MSAAAEAAMTAPSRSIPSPAAMDTPPPAQAFAFGNPAEGHGRHERIIETRAAHARLMELIDEHIRLATCAELLIAELAPLFHADVIARAIRREPATFTLSARKLIALLTLATRVEAALK